MTSKDEELENQRVEIRRTLGELFMKNGIAYFEKGKQETTQKILELIEKFDFNEIKERDLSPDDLLLLQIFSNRLTQKIKEQVKR